MRAWVGGLVVLLSGCVASPPRVSYCPALDVAKSEPMWAEIFDAGVYDIYGKRRQVTTGDLDRMVYNFQLLRRTGHWHVPLKLGHGPQQIIGGKHGKQGDPALGWVRHLERRGSKLMAEFVDVPPLIKAMMDRHEYRTVSIEWYKDFEDTAWEANLKSGARGYVLDAVAILGADRPKVTTLADLGAYL